MKKLLCILSILVVLICALSSCDDNEPKVSVNEDGYVVVNGVKTEYKTDAGNANTIRYSVDIGTKIEALSTADQKLIDEYVNDCKTIMATAYSHNYLTKDYELYSNPYFAFTDTAVYDFRNVDEASMGEKSLKLWNLIKETVGQGKEPIMYIELDGYACIWSDNFVRTSFEESAKINGFFVFADDSVIQLNYTQICKTFYIYQLIDGTEIINCGDKYAEDLSKEEIMTFDKEPIRLKTKE